VDWLFRALAAAVVVHLLEEYGSLRERAYVPGTASAVVYLPVGLVAVAAAAR
jgi:TRAP-type uncharacterized transport system fused permease subunit